MWNIFIVVILVFLSGAVFGIGTVLMVDWYYMRKWKKEKENDE